MHSGRAAVPYQSEIPYVWLKNCQCPLNIAGMFQNFDQSSQKALGLVDFKDINICLNFRLCIRMSKIWYFKNICKFFKNISCDVIQGVSLHYASRIILIHSMLEILDLLMYAIAYSLGTVRLKETFFTSIFGLNLVQDGTAIA